MGEISTISSTYRRVESIRIPFPYLTPNFSVSVLFEIIYIATGQIGVATECNPLSTSPHVDSDANSTTDILIGGFNEVRKKPLALFQFLPENLSVDTIKSLLKVYKTCS